MQLAAFRAASSGGDTTPPTAPSNLTVTGSTSSQVSLGWSGSTDNVGVTGYLIDRCTGAGCSSFVQIGTSATTSYTDTTVSASNSYTYKVQATDAAGNLSAFSNTTTATTSSGDT